MIAQSLLGGQSSMKYDAKMTVAEFNKHANKDALLECPRCTANKRYDAKPLEYFPPLHCAFCKACGWSLKIIEWHWYANPHLWKSTITVSLLTIPVLLVLVIAMYLK